MPNPWEEIPDHPPYVLPGDRLAVDQFNAQANEMYRFHTDQRPVPFIGQPAAPIVLLSRNPWFDPNQPALNDDPIFVQCWRANLLHSPCDYPFFPLNPALPDQAGGRHWWQQKLSSLLQERPRQRVAQSLLSVEFAPYHSVRFRGPRLHLASQAYGFWLVREALGRQALILIMRARRAWVSAIPELNAYSHVSRLNSVANVTISPGNCPDYARILARIPAT